MKTVKRAFVLLLIGSISLGFSSKSYARNFHRILTMEAAENPASAGVIGLQRLGWVLGPVFIDTNPALDIAFTANVGAKLVFPLTEDSAVTFGGRYMKFLGTELINERVRQQDSRIEEFNLDYDGLIGFVGAKKSFALLDLHINGQIANLSGSKIGNLVLGAVMPFADVWGLAIEGGYDFANDQPRASFGVLRQGPSFGLRLGATYVEINDPFLQYEGLVPVIDFHWLIGGITSGEK